MNSALPFTVNVVVELIVVDATWAWIITPLACVDDAPGINCTWARPLASVVAMPGDRLPLLKSCRAVKFTWRLATAFPLASLTTASIVLWLVVPDVFGNTLPGLDCTTMVVGVVATN